MDLKNYYYLNKEDTKDYNNDYLLRPIQKLSSIKPNVGETITKPPQIPCDLKANPPEKCPGGKPCPPTGICPITPTPGPPPTPTPTLGCCSNTIDSQFNNTCQTTNKCLAGQNGTFTPYVCNGKNKGEKCSPTPAGPKCGQEGDWSNDGQRVWPIHPKNACECKDAFDDANKKDSNIYIAWRYNKIENKGGNHECSLYTAGQRDSGPNAHNYIYGESSNLHSSPPPVKTEWNCGTCPYSTAKCPAECEQEIIDGCSIHGNKYKCSCPSIINKNFCIDIN